MFARHLPHGHEETGQARHMVSVQMGDKNPFQFAHGQFRPNDLCLGAFPAVKQKNPPVALNSHGRKVARQRGDGPTRSEDDNFYDHEINRQIGKSAKQ